VVYRDLKPENVVLENLVAQIGRTDIRATGTLANFIAYTFGKGSLNGTLDLQSNVFDANEWLAKDPQAKWIEKEAEYAEMFANPYRAAELGFMDAIILPEETRKRVYEYLVALKNKKQEKPKRKHGNIQL
jgi:acetyl-CoA carboxylase carboxyltransferase component